MFALKGSDGIKKGHCCCYCQKLIGYFSFSFCFSNKLFITFVAYMKQILKYTSLFFILFAILFTYSSCEEEQTYAKQKEREKEKKQYLKRIIDGLGIDEEIYTYESQILSDISRIKNFGSNPYEAGVKYVSDEVFGRIYNERF